MELKPKSLFKNKMSVSLIKNKMIILSKQINKIIIYSTDLKETQW